MANETVITARVEAGEGIKTIRDLQNSVKSYRNELANLERGTKEYNKVLADLTNVQGQINSINQDIAASTTNLTGAYQNVTGALSGIAGGFSAVQGVIALTGSDTENLEKTFVKLQAALALTQGLTAFSNGIKAARIAMLALNTAIAANPLAALGIALVAVVAGIVSFVSSSNNAIKETENLTEALEKQEDQLRINTQILSREGKKVVDILGAQAKAYEDLIDSTIKKRAEYSRQLSTMRGNEAKEAREHYDELSELLEDYTSRYLKIQDDRIKESSKILRAEGKTTTEVINAELKAYEDLIANAVAERQKANRQLSLATGLEDTRAAKEAYDTQTMLIEEYTAKVLKLNGDLNIETISENTKRNAKIAADNEASRKKELAEQEKQAAENKKYREDYEKGLEETNKIISDRALAQQKALTVDQDRIDLIKLELSENQNLLNQYQQIIDTPGVSDKDKAEARRNYNAALSDSIAIQNELQEAEKQLNDDRIGFEKSLKEAQGYPEDWTDEDIANAKKEALETEIDSLWEVANNIELSYAERQMAIDSYMTKVEELDTLNAQSAASEKKLNDEKKKSQQQLYSTYAGLLSNSADLLSDNVIVSKGLQVASATISTYAGAAQVLANPAQLSPFVKWAQFATTIATGLSAVKNILAVQVPGGSSGSTASIPAESVPLPNMPELDTPIQETHNNLNAYDEDIINRNQPVLVVEDLNNVSSRVQVAEGNSTF